MLGRGLEILVELGYSKQVRVFTSNGRSELGLAERAVDGHGM